MGGVAGYSSTETTDEDPGRVALLNRVAVAYLRHVLALGDAGWRSEQANLAGDADPAARLDSR